MAHVEVCVPGRPSSAGTPPKHAVLTQPDMLSSAKSTAPALALLSDPTSSDQIVGANSRAGAPPQAAAAQEVAPAPAELSKAEQQRLRIRAKNQRAQVRYRAKKKAARESAGAKLEAVAADVERLRLDNQRLVAANQVRRSADAVARGGGGGCFQPPTAQEGTPGSAGGDRRQRAAVVHGPLCGGAGAGAGVGCSRLLGQGA